MGTPRREYARRRARGVARALGAACVLGASIGFALARPVAAADAPAAAVEQGAPAAAIEEGAPAAAASLRAARAALAQGQREKGVALLAAVEERHPIVSDHAALLAARALVEAQRWDEASAVVTRFQARGLSTPLESELERARGDAALGAGQPAAAHEAFRRALLSASDPMHAAPLLLALARLEESAGDPGAAAERWLALWRDHPAQPAARGSGEQLESLGRTLGRELRSGLDAKARGDRLFDAGLRESALDAYDLALARGLEGEARARTLRRRAEALFGLRRYAEAEGAFAALRDDAEAQVYAARAVARGGDVVGGVRQLLAEAEKRPGPGGAQARWFAALLLDGENETARAEPLFDAVARDATDPALRAGAQWRLGWAAYRAGRPAEARRRFEQMSAVALEPVAKLQGRYWAARAGEKAGQGEPERELSALVQEAPFTYYGWRARGWLAKRGALPKPGAPRPALPPGEPALGPRDAERARILVQAELGDVATEEIDRLAARAGSVSDTLLVTGLYREAGAFDRAQGSVVKRHGDALPGGPTEGQEGLWRAAWPQAFAQAVRRGAGNGTQLEPALVWALMREESGFRPAVASPAGARGLMQLMPATAARVADQIGLSGYDDDLLVDPATNIRLGTAYLDGLMGRFGGRASAAIGSYNAGPEPVARWLAERPGQADDEWVESIPYEETRNYVKRVLRSRHAYRELYADER